MKKTILFALIAILFLALFTGCRAYRGHNISTPGNEVVHRDGEHARGFHYRHDGYVSHGRQHARHGYRQDGLVTDTDGRIGNGTFADRPVLDGAAVYQRPAAERAAVVTQPVR